MNEVRATSALREKTLPRKADANIVDACSAGERAAGVSLASNLNPMLPHRITALSKRVNAALSKIYAPHYLDVDELEVLGVVAGSGRSTAKDVCRHTGMHKTKISRAVKQLIERNLVTRTVNQADLRQAFLSLTPVGRDAYNRCFQSALQFAELLERAIEPSECEAFYRCFTQLERHLCS
jgi:DNA-binding MarR family transcriptional regulator